MTIKTIPQLIKAARNGRSQAEFANELGVRQSTLSRYERGDTNPKANVIERCMHLVHGVENENEPSADALANKIRVLLGRDDQAMLRVMISKLIDGLVTEKKQGRRTSYAQRNQE